MSKDKRIFSILVTVSILFLITFATNFLSAKIKTDDHSKLNDNGVSTIEYSPPPPVITTTGQKKTVSKYTSDDFQAGMNVLIYGHPDIAEASKIFERLQSLGINSIAINFPFYQTGWRANEVTVSPINTPTITELEEIIEEAHDAGLSVMLKPIMDEEVFLPSGMWRGQIKPEDPYAWFASYEALLLTYAELAQSTTSKALNIGTELNSMQNQYNDRWIELIENVRHVYKGELLYSFNWDTVDEIPAIEFVEALDYVGIDAYFPLNVSDRASVEMLEEEWARQIAQLKDNLSQKPIVVTEAGIIPVKGVYRTPYVWDKPEGEFDPQVQVNYYEATFNVWKPKIHGIYWWTVTLGQDPDVISFSPLYSPTEKVIKRHFLKDVSHE